MHNNARSKYDYIAYIWAYNLYYICLHYSHKYHYVYTLSNRQLFVSHYNHYSITRVHCTTVLSCSLIHFKTSSRYVNCRRINNHPPAPPPARTCCARPGALHRVCRHWSEMMSSTVETIEPTSQSVSPHTRIAAQSDTRSVSQALLMKCIVLSYLSNVRQCILILSFLLFFICL